MYNLTVINNIIEFESLLKNKFDFTNKAILTTNIELSQKYNNEYKIINLWKYLDDEIVEKSEKVTQNISDNFVLPAGSEIMNKNVNVFEISKVFLRYFYKGVLHSYFALEKMLAETDTGSVFIKEDKTLPMNVVYFDKSHVLDGVCEYFFRERDINVSNFKYDNPITENKSARYNFEPSDYRFDFEYLKGSKNRILFILSENFEWDFELVKILQKKHNNVCTILRTAQRESKHKDHKGNPVYFDDFGFDTTELIEEYEKIERIKNSFFYRDSGIADEFPFIFKNSYLDFQFTDFFDRLKLYVKDLHSFERINCLVKPDKVYFSNSWDMSVRCMVKLAEDEGIETFTSIHGGVVDNAGYLTRKFETSNYLVWGKDNYEGLIKAGQDAKSIKILGSMQMESWNEKLKSRDNNDLQISSEYENIYNSKLREVEKSNKIVITFFTSSGGGFSGHSINEYEHLNSLRQIINLAKKNKHIEFRIKPHVLFDYFIFWENMKNELPDNLKIVKKNNLLEACVEMNLGVLLNVISNVAFEISLTGKPLIFLKDAVFNVECGESTIERGGILCLDSFQEFENYLNDLIKTSNKLKSEDDFIEQKYKDGENNKWIDLENRRRKFIEYSLTGFSKPVVGRIEELLIKGEFNNIIKTDLDAKVYEVIKWVSNYIKTDKLNSFPEIKDFNNLPEGEDFLNWIYILTVNWCQYFKKENKVTKYFENLLNNLPKETGIDNRLKLKRKMYAKSRALYLKYNLNENENFRKIVKKIIN